MAKTTRERSTEVLQTVVLLLRYQRHWRRMLLVLLVLPVEAKLVLRSLPDVSQGAFLAQPLLPLDELVRLLAVELAVYAPAPDKNKTTNNKKRAREKQEDRRHVSDGQHGASKDLRDTQPLKGTKTWVDRRCQFVFLQIYNGGAKHPKRGAITSSRTM